MGRAIRKSLTRSFSENDFPDIDLDMDLDDDFGFDDPDSDEGDDGYDLRTSTLRRARSDSDVRGHLSTRNLPQDWADFDYSGNDDAFDSPWR